MSIFKYTLPSGAQYTMETPQGYTQAQADLIFYSQVAAGSLVGYTQGQQLSSASTKLTKFGLSRLDRGTAGVDLATILAIILNSPVVATTPNLANVALQNPINAADYSQASTPLGVTPVGPLTSSQTQAILAQISNLVDQDANTVSTNGVGEYAFSPNSLEQAGYLKPGTSNYPDYNCVVGTPEVWTGKDGVYSLASVLGDQQLQGQIQTEIMQNGYDALTAAGTIQTQPKAPISLSQGQVYTNTGLSTLTPIALISGAAVASGSLNGLVSQAFAGAGNISSLLSNPVTNISTLASGAVNEITQGLANLPGNITSAANNLVTGTLNSLTGQAGQLVAGTVGQLNSGLNQVTSLASGITNATSGAVGSLITNASQFGSQVTAAWAQGSDLLSSALGSGASSLSGITDTLSSGLSSATSAISGLTDSLSSTIGSATTALSGAMGDLTNMASTALSGLTGQAQSLAASLGGSLDIFGKMGSFSIDFSLFSSDSLVSATKVAAGYSNTVDRQTVDAAVNRILGNPKIPAPQFEFPSPGSLNLGADIQYAKNMLNSITGTATNLINQGTQIVNQVTTTASNIQSAATRIVG